MNQKGIVLSGLIYALLTFFLLLVVSLLTVMWYRQNALNSLSDSAHEIYENIPISSTNDYVVSKGVNAPRIASGMTPIKWNGNSWVDTLQSDIDWYDYKTKKWANARTEDGSMWVWIPRYAYQIASGYHTSTVGTINIKFLIDQTNKTSDGTTVSLTPTYSGSSQTNYITHPAFKFGDTELTGIWVAKFEASGTTNAINILPNVPSLRSLIIGDMFTASRNMETNSRYGWGTSGVGIDTHMMKNIEWGAVMHLAQSTYGKNGEIWNNPSSSYITGCAGNSASASEMSGCSNHYDSINGQQTSTTGNIYGVYDMVGGSWEYTVAYIDNDDSSLTTYGNNILNANNKYKDIYVVTTDNPATNYENASTKFGDAVYETSSTGEIYNEYSYMPFTNRSWFLRGGYCTFSTGTGRFFSSASGTAHDSVSFRAVLLVEKGI